MVLQIRKVIATQQEDVDFITEKFRNVTEIISLQQQFIGELGTENVVSVKAMLGDVVKMCQAPLEQRDIKLNTDFMATARVLLDPAMMRHILLILLKYSIESVTASRKVNPSITLTALEAKEDGRAWVRIMIADNGAGINMDLETLDKRLEEHPNDERLRDLNFCRHRIAKYGGRLTMASDMARGLRTVIEIPEYVADDEAEEARLAKPERPTPGIAALASETQDIAFEETRIIDRADLGKT
jgi:signal transduction histidine kinase